MSGLSFHLQPQNTDVDSLLRPVFSLFFELGFDNKKCQHALGAFLEKGTVDSKYFNLDQISKGGCFSNNELLIGNYDIYEKYYLFVGYNYGKDYWTDYLTVNQAKEYFDTIDNFMMRLRCDDKNSWKEAGKSILDNAILESLASEKINSSVWPEPNVPGIYRREHASLLIKSDKTLLISDPQSLSGSWTTNNSVYPFDRGNLCADVICITHGHHDHWHLPSVIASSKTEHTEVIVPITSTNLLSTINPKKMIQELTRLHVLETPWWHKHVVGDIEITTLPFYGEQPTVEIPIVDKRVRNWGNTYRFSVNGRSIVLLSDSGIDPEGSMLDVLQKSVIEDGPIDFLIGCCSEFPEIINPGIPEMLFALKFDDIRQEYLKRDSIQKINSVTLGIDGVVKACQISQAKYFLPYAHGFSGLFKVETQNINEKYILQILSNKLKESGVKTKIIDWIPGDVIQFKDYR